MNKSGGKKTVAWSMVIVLGLVIVGASAVLLGEHQSSAATTQDVKRSPDGVWQDVSERTIQFQSQREMVPNSYRTLRLNRDALNVLLARVPLEFTQAAKDSATEMALPLPDGSFTRFKVVESPMMEPALAAQYPEIKTYQGYGLDDRSASMRFDITQRGFRAIILSAAGTIYMDPFTQNDTEHYISYYKRDYVQNAPFHCTADEQVLMSLKPDATPSLKPDGATLNLTRYGVRYAYRLAMAATGEYTTAFRQPNDTDQQARSRAFAAMLTTMNRINAIYIRDLGISMSFVAGENDIIYTNANTDPYNGLPGTDTINNENQTNLDKVIGNANYDVGHVVGVSTGGRAQIQSVCSSDKKAKGSTGRPTPSGDAFDVDYVAHELGHQFGATHTFNNNTNGSCGNTGQYTATSAYEPGGGSTIMAYAGICGASDLQPNSDDYFHVKSIDQIIDYTSKGGGSGCATVSNTYNTMRIILLIGSYTIPANTPFELPGINPGDDENDSLSFTWEEYDLGAASPPESDDGSRPILRSYR